MSKRQILALAAALAIVVGAFASRWVGPHQPSASSVTGSAVVGTDGVKLAGVSRKAPGQRGAPVDLSGKTLTGSTLDVAAWRGSVVVINIWGSWCGPCRAEAPTLVRVQAATQKDGVRFLGIDVRDTTVTANAFVARFGISYPSLVDDGGTLLLPLRHDVPVSAVPSTAVLDRKGRVSGTIIGRVSEAGLTALIKEAVDEQ